MRGKSALDRAIDRIDAPVQRSKVMAADLGTHYLIAGQGNPLLLMHGGGAGAVQWAPIIGPPSQHFRVISHSLISRAYSARR